MAAPRCLYRVTPRFNAAGKVDGVNFVQQSCHADKTAANKAACGASQAAARAAARDPASSAGAWYGVCPPSMPKTGGRPVLKKCKLYAPPYRW